MNLKEIFEQITTIFESILPKPNPNRHPRYIITDNQSKVDDEIESLLDAVEIAKEINGKIEASGRSLKIEIRQGVINKKDLDIQEEIKSETWYKIPFEAINTSPKSPLNNLPSTQL